MARDRARGFRVETTAGSVTADAVVLAISAYHRPRVPAMAETLPLRVAS